jgi:hypothetical protein
MKIKKLFLMIFSLFFLISSQVVSKADEKKNVPLTTKELKKWEEKMKKEPLDENYKKPHDGDIYFSCQGDMESSFRKNDEIVRQKVRIVDRDRSFLTFIFHPKSRYFEGDSFKDGRCRFSSMTIYCTQEDKKEFFTISINRINGKIRYENLKKNGGTEYNPHEHFSGFCKRVDIIF